MQGLTATMKHGVTRKRCAKRLNVWYCVKLNEVAVKKFFLVLNFDPYD